VSVPPASEGEMMDVAALLAAGLIWYVGRFDLLT
jgi:hypothetical protein